MLPLPLDLEAREDELVRTYMAVDAHILELIRTCSFRELLSYKPTFSGVLKAEGEGFRSIFQLDRYGVLRGLVIGQLPMSVEV